MLSRTGHGLRVVLHLPPWRAFGDETCKFQIGDSALHFRRCRFERELDEPIPAVPSLEHEVSEARRLKSLEDENRRVKKLLDEAMLDNASLKDLLGKNR